MFLLSSQYALVTGANRGIGKAIAMMLAKQGAWVAGTSTTLAGVRQISEQFTNLQLPGQGFLLNINDKQSITKLTAQLKSLNKTPSILINNAGITRDGLALRLTAENWEAVINTNLSAAFYLTQQCLMPMLKARYGRIINISSIVGITGNLGQTNYAAAKAGLIGFSKSLALEVASRSITVNVIAPGFIDTEMTAALSNTQRDSFIQKIPTQQLGLPESVAHACVFLAAKESSYITGQTLHVNGGLLMH